MVSEKQLTETAKMPEGKVVTKQSYLKHGFYRKTLAQEEVPQFDYLLNRFIKEFEPQTLIEEILIQQMAFCQIQLDRLMVAEMKEYVSQCKHESELFGGGISNDYFCKHHYERIKPGAYDIFSQYAARLENRIYKALKHLKKIRKARADEMYDSQFAVSVTES